MPPREIALLTNPTSGKGKGGRVSERALARLREGGLVVRNLQGRDPDEALDLAHQCVADGVEALVVCGGDGMVHLAVQAVATTSTALGIIPAGTGNDIARYFDLPRSHPEAAADRVVAGLTRTIDLARSGSRFFVTVLAAGFDAVVNERANRDVLAQGPDALQHRDACRAARLRAAALHPPDRRSGAVSSMRCSSRSATARRSGEGCGSPKGAVLDDGLLDVVIIKPMSKLNLIRTYPKLFKGTHVTHPQYEHHLARSVTVAAPGIVSYADGERFGPLPLTVECAPGALTVLA